MCSKPCLLDWTVLDLCEASYRTPFGYFYDTVKTFDLEHYWKLIVICINGALNDQEHILNILLEDYAPLEIKPVSFDVSVQELHNLCKIRKLPVFAQVADCDEKFLVIATCHDPWSLWFDLIFGPYDEKTQTAGIDELQPEIMSLLTDLHRRK